MLFIYNIYIMAAIVNRIIYIFNMQAAFLIRQSSLHAIIVNALNTAGVVALY